MVLNTRPPLMPEYVTMMLSNMEFAFSSMTALYKNAGHRLATTTVTVEWGGVASDSSVGEV